MGIEKRALDPRRVPRELYGPVQREEGSLPYNASFALSPRAFLSLGRPVHGLKGVFSAPSRLESTAHLLAAGVDLFYSRVCPSHAFDQLDAAFNRPALL